MPSQTVAAAATPKSHRIVDAMLADIAAGSLRSGDALPSERVLATTHGVSLGTVQRAMQMLAQQGVIRREHGRGSFVSGKGASVDTRYVRFQDAVGNELPVFWHLTGWSEIEVLPWLQPFFGKRRLVCIERRVDVAGRFTLASQFFLRRTDFRALFAVDEPRDDSNLRELISTRLAMPSLRVAQLVSHAPLQPPAAAIVGAKAGAMGMVLDVKGYTVDDRPVYWQRVQGPLLHDACLMVDARVV